MKKPIHVVKLGGSLLDLADLPGRFSAFRAGLEGERVALVVGGGEGADVVREFDRLHSLGEEAGHWLAVRAMSLNAHMVAAVLPRCRMVADRDACDAAWETDDLALLDPLAWLELEHARGVSIPHRWTFTSDSIAAHVAVRLRAQKLTLLKSTPPPPAHDPKLAVDSGIVDADFPAAANGIPVVEIVNLRKSP